MIWKKQTLWSELRSGLCSGSTQNHQSSPEKRAAVVCSHPLGSGAWQVWGSRTPWRPYRETGVPEELGQSWFRSCLKNPELSSQGSGEPLKSCKPKLRVWFTFQKDPFGLRSWTWDSKEVDWIELGDSLKGKSDSEEGRRKITWQVPVVLGV